MAYSQFTFKKRQRLEHLLCLTRNLSEIARRLGMHRSTISRELSRNGVGNRYKAKRAQESAMGRKLRPKGILMVNRRASRRFIPRYATYLTKSEKPEKRIFTGKDLSSRIPNFLTEWKKFLRKDRYKTFRRKKVTYQNVRTYPRKRDHGYENYLRGRRMWALVVRYRTRAAYYRYRYTDSSKAGAGANRSVLLKRSKTRPDFPIGYWRRHLKDFINGRKEMLQKEICEKRLTVADTTSLSKSRKAAERKRKNKITSGKNTPCLGIRRTRLHTYSKFSPCPLRDDDQHEKLLVKNTNIGVGRNAVDRKRKIYISSGRNKHGHEIRRTPLAIRLFSPNALSSDQGLLLGKLWVKNTSKGARTGAGPPGRFFLKKIKAVFRTAFFYARIFSGKTCIFYFLPDIFSYPISFPFF